MQIAFFYDQTRCIGCYACVVSCKQWNLIPPGPAIWRRVLTIERGKYPDVSVRFLSIACCHCENPACLKVCPAHAITKRDMDGIVIVDKEICLGGKICGFACRKACPYDAPQFGAEENPKMQKCNFCIERLEENRKPICVEACITKALDAAPLELLKRRYHQISETRDFAYAQHLKPAIFIKPKHNKNEVAD